MYFLNRPLTSVDSFAKTLTFTWNAADQRTKVIDSFGGITVSAYDRLNRLIRRDFSAPRRADVRVEQTLTVRPQPRRAWRLLQKTRQARTVFLGLLSSKPCKKPCRFSVPITLQCGQGSCLSRSASALHSSSLPQNHRSSPTPPMPPRKS